MKKTLIAISVACVGALVAMADDEVAQPAPYETLVFETNDWFEVKASGLPDPYVGGTVTQGEFTVVSESLAFNSKDVPVVFLTDKVYTQEFAMVSLDVKASTVPYGRPALAADKIAVALYESTKNEATNFVASVGGEQQLNLVGAAVPYEGDDYKLLIRFDNRGEGQKVAFAWEDADGVEYPLTNGTENAEWFNDYTVDFKTNQQMNVGFLGKGVLNDLKGVQLSIFVAVVPTTNGYVVVDKKDNAAFEKDQTVQDKGGVAEYMKSDASETYSGENYRFQKGISVAQAYALGLIKTENGEVKVMNNGAIEVKAESAKLTGSGLKVKFVDITPNTNSCEEIKFKLYGSANGTTWDTNPIGEFAEADAIVIPVSEFGTKHYFKVVTEVKLFGAPEHQEN